MITHVSFCVYAVTDMKKSRAFYEGVLGLKPGKEFDGSKNPNWVEYELVTEGPGAPTAAAFAIGCSPLWKPSQDGATIALETDDFEGFVAGLKKAGVPFHMDAQDFPSCHMAVVQDPDLNKIIIHKKK